MTYTDIMHDVDSSEDVWNKLYNIVYIDRFGDVFNFKKREDKETSVKCKRWYIKISEKQTELKKKYPQFKMAGDCDFNFNTKKVAIFEKMLGESNEGRMLLECCKNNHHKLFNFSFMPITGGMNSKKGILRYNGDEVAESKPLDRFDIFINELDRYYKIGETRLFSRYNRDALAWYLSNFSNVYEYFKDIYLIDNPEFVNKIIQSGSKPISNPQQVLNYMKLASEYWELKADSLKGYGIICD